MTLYKISSLVSLFSTVQLYSRSSRLPYGLSSRAKEKEEDDDDDEKEAKNSEKKKEKERALMTRTMTI